MGVFNKPTTSEIAPKRIRGAWLSRLLTGIFTWGMHPKVLATARRDIPSDTDLSGLSGADLIQHEANRTARRASFAMENVAYWTNVAMEILGSVNAIAGTLGGMFQVASEGAKAAAGRILSAEIAQSTRTIAKLPPAVESEAPSVARVMLSIRDETLRIVERMEVQLARQGQQFTASARGEFADAVAKTLARDAIGRGVLPNTLRIAPPPSSITGVPIFKQPAIDFWLPNGKGFDLMTATVRSVAGHDMRYIGRVMPDGTIIREVLPLVYPVRSRPWLSSVRSAAGSAAGATAGASYIKIDDNISRSRPAIKIKQGFLTPSSRSDIRGGNSRNSQQLQGPESKQQERDTRERQQRELSQRQVHEAQQRQQREARERQQRELSQRQMREAQQRQQREARERQIREEQSRRQYSVRGDSLRMRPGTYPGGSSGPSLPTSPSRFHWNNSRSAGSGGMFSALFRVTTPQRMNIRPAQSSNRLYWEPRTRTWD